jgi:hypothetical protein
MTPFSACQFIDVPFRSHRRLFAGKIVSKCAVIVGLAYRDGRPSRTLITWIFAPSPTRSRPVHHFVLSR